ncbi:hypothetical protein BSY240_4721 (plasmid) [Agrobacterium sp. RAC06]|nr:hypothetical protein BSY240_4721 [Agrobacterium sp. RAC06]
MRIYIKSELRQVFMFEHRAVDNLITVQKSLTSIRVPPELITDWFVFQKTCWAEFPVAINVQLFSHRRRMRLSF